MKYDLIVKEVNVEELGFTDVVMVNGKFQEVMGFTNISGKCTIYFSDGTYVVYNTGETINKAEGYETSDSVHETDNCVYHETFDVTEVYPSELFIYDTILIKGIIGIVLYVGEYIDKVSVVYLSEDGVSIFSGPKNDMPKITRVVGLVSKGE